MPNCKTSSMLPCVHTNTHTHQAPMLSMHIHITSVKIPEYIEKRREEKRKGEEKRSKKEKRRGRVDERWRETRWSIEAIIFPLTV